MLFLKKDFHSPGICQSGWRPFVLFATVRFLKYLNIRSKETLFGSRQEGQRTYEVVHTWGEKQLTLVMVQLWVFLFFWGFFCIHESVSAFVCGLVILTAPPALSGYAQRSVCFQAAGCSAGRVSKALYRVRTLHISQLRSVAGRCCP